MEIGYFTLVHAPDCRTHRHHSLNDGESLRPVGIVGNVTHEALYDAQVSVEHSGNTSTELEH